MDARGRKLLLLSLTMLFITVLTVGLFFALSPSQRSASPPKLLLVSLDGFHYRYLQQFPNETRFLRQHFADKGLFAEHGMRSVFATKTFAIHWTLATGLYEESHGILGNVFYDPLFNETFTSKAANDSKWFEGEPIWSVAQKQGKRVGVSQWLGSSVNFKDDRLSPLFLDPYEHCSDPEEIRNKLSIVREFLFDKDSDFVMLYFNEPDRSGHWYGAASDGVAKALREIDAALAEFMAGIEGEEEINVIILSDHGMKNITKWVFLDDLLAEGEKMDQVSDYTDDGGIIMEIWPKAGMLEKVYQKLLSLRGNDFDVYLQPDIPDRWHFKHHRRNSPLLLVAKERVQVWKKRTSENRKKGDHGFDNEFDSMRPFFVAKGPAFREKARISDPIGLENIYALCCHLLQITPGPNNGSVTPFEAYLTEYKL